MNYILIKCLNATVLLAILLFVCESSLQAQAVAKSVVTNQEGDLIPFDYDPLLNPSPVIHIRINGSEPMPFMLDTGTSGPLGLDIWAAKRLKLTPNGQKMHVINGNKRGEVAALKKVDLIGREPGTMKRISVPVDLDMAGILDLGIPSENAVHERIAGIFGLAIFDHATACFDFVAKTVTLYPDPHPPIHLPGAFVLPIKQAENGLFTVGLTDAEGGTVDAIIDTGNAGVTLPASLALRFHPAATPAVFRRSVMVDGLHLSKRLLLPSLKIGDLTEANIVVDTHIKPSQIVSLGMSYLRRFRVTLDFYNSQMLLERASDYAEQSRLPGVTGIILMRSAKEFHVIDVLPSSPASQAGIRIGDIIVQIDNHPIVAMPSAAVHQRLDGWADTPIELLVKRGNAQPTQIKFRRKSLFSLADKLVGGAIIGIAVEHTDDMKLLVIAVEGDSVARKAGITVGDEILKINALVVAKTPIEQLMAALQPSTNSTLTLQIVRKGEKKTSEVKLMVEKL